MDALLLTHIVNIDYVWMGQAGRSLGLPPEPFDEFCITCILLP